MIFRSLVVKLQYLGKRTRPNILVAISFLASRVQKATQDDWKKLNGVIKYIRATKELLMLHTVCMRTASRLRVLHWCCHSCRKRNRLCQIIEAEVDR
jgi:hypothetical protein